VCCTDDVGVSSTSRIPVLCQASQAEPLPPSVIASLRLDPQTVAMLEANGRRATQGRHLSVVGFLLQICAIYEVRWRLGLEDSAQGPRHPYVALHPVARRPRRAHAQKQPNTHKTRNMT